jgi:hypothetical protein
LKCIKTGGLRAVGSGLPIPAPSANWQTGWSFSVFSAKAVNIVRKTASKQNVCSRLNASAALANSWFFRSFFSGFYFCSGVRQMQR